jgi:putative membrane protein
MTLSFAIAYIHILTLGIGFYAIWARANALKKLKDATDLDEVVKADNFWGLAALLWLITGLWRAFGGLEKGSHYYLHSTAFIVKISLFILIMLIELQPMITLIQWRIKSKKGQAIDISPARRFAFMSHLELGLLSIMVLLAIAIARGEWY